MKTDVLIIGAGSAGLMTALALAEKQRKVVVLSGGPLGESCSSVLAQGGLAAAVDKDDSPALHAADTLKAAAGTADPAVVNALVAAAPEAAALLDKLGVRFDRDAAEDFKLNREACHSRRRVLKARAGDGFGKELMRALVKAARNTPAVTVLENVSAERLIVQSRRVTGVTTGAGGAIAANAVVLATGGLGGLYAATTNPLSSVGRGIALAARAGALLSDLEFVQFHPTALDIGEDPAPLASEALRGDGALLLNSRGERFMKNYHPMAELAPRDVVSRAIFAEMQRGQKVYLDCRSLDTAHFPALVAACRRANIDPQHSLVPVFPVAHYHMGGVATDLNGRTSLQGLWAAGETAATGLHGANRLASNSLMEAIVMARHVACDISTHVACDISAHVACDISVDGAAETPPEQKTVSRPAERLRLRQIMTDCFGVARNGETMQSGLRGILALEEAARNDAALADMALVAKMVAVAALARTESRGGHFRPDYPAPLKVWEKRSFMTLRNIDALAEKALAPLHAKEKIA